MAAQEKQLFEIPSDEEAKLAADSSRILAACSGQGDTATLRLIDDGKDIIVPVIQGVRLNASKLSSKLLITKNFYML